MQAPHTEAFHILQWEVLLIKMHLCI